jgi:hypothetical protein
VRADASTDYGTKNVKSETHRAAESNFNDGAGGLPHNIEAEQGLLGALLINNEAYTLVSRLIETRDFELEAWLQAQPNADPAGLHSGHLNLSDEQALPDESGQYGQRDVMRNLW